MQNILLKLKSCIFFISQDSCLIDGNMTSLTVATVVVVAAAVAVAVAAAAAQVVKLVVPAYRQEQNFIFLT